MDKNRIEGKVKDVTGRIQRQAGEWTGDPEKQTEGAAKQVEGKLQNAIGKIKDSTKSAAERIKISPKPPQKETDSTDAPASPHQASRSRR